MTNEELIAENRKLHEIAARQQDTIACQQETIVQLSWQMDSILICLAEKYGLTLTGKDGSESKRLSFKLEKFPDAYDRCTCRAEKKDGKYIIYVSERDTQGKQGEGK